MVLQEITQIGIKEELMEAILAAMNNSIHEQVRKQETKGIEM